MLTLSMWKQVIKHPLQSINWGLTRVIPPDLHLDLLSAYTNITPYRNKIKIIHNEDSVKIKNVDTGENYYFPESPWIYEAELVEKGYSDHLKNKYSLSDFVFVEQGDIVIDVGAFIGGFSLAIAEKASVIHSIEPSPESFEALKQNTAGNENISIHNVAATSQNSTLKFEQGVNPTDGSIISADHGGLETISVPGVRLDCYDEIPKEIDFLKIEAEGAEPEVLNGIDNISVKKVAVDCSPERNGESPIQQVQGILQNKGYRTQTVDNMVFARLKEM